MTGAQANVTEALTAVEFAIKVIHSETREHARRLHKGFLTARDINTDTIAAHWDTIANAGPTTRMAVITDYGKISSNLLQHNIYQVPIT